MFDSALYDPMIHRLLVIVSGGVQPQAYMHAMKVLVIGMLIAESVGDDADRRALVQHYSNSPAFRPSDRAIFDRIADQLRDIDAANAPLRQIRDALNRAVPDENSA